MCCCHFGNEWIDFIPFGTNKAKGIQRISERYHISPEECIAFGDEYNDIEMLKAVNMALPWSIPRRGTGSYVLYDETG